MRKRFSRYQILHVQRNCCIGTTVRFSEVAGALSSTGAGVAMIRYCLSGDAASSAEYYSNRAQWHQHRAREGRGSMMPMWARLIWFFFQIVRQISVEFQSYTDNLFLIRNKLLT